MTAERPTLFEFNTSTLLEKALQALPSQIKLDQTFPLLLFFFWGGGGGGGAAGFVTVHFVPFFSFMLYSLFDKS